MNYLYSIIKRIVRYLNDKNNQMEENNSYQNHYANRYN